MQTWNAQLLFKHNLILGEGALWNPVWKKFLYVDIEGKKLGCIDAHEKNINEKQLDKMIGTVVPANNNKLIIAVQGAIHAIDFETGETNELIKIEPDKPANRCNDGKCDAAGRLWFGTMNVNAKHQSGALYVFDGTLRKVLDKTSISNGICWSKNNKTMYYIDSFDYNIKAYDFNVDDGTITNQRIVIEIDNHDVLADGMCIDEDDMLWVAIWNGGCVHRYNPLSGALIGKVFINAPHVTSCAFGGDDMQQLFITTATSGLTKKQMLQHSLSGSLFIVQTGIKGLPVNFFKYPVYN